jgi:4-amino-4-deoxy-L-arabinose transferase
LSIWLTFLIASLLFRSEKVALLAAFFHAVNGLAIELAGGRIATDHIDTYFLCFVEASVWCLLASAQRNRSAFLMGAGLACGLAIMTKWLPALVVFPMYWVYQSGRRPQVNILKDLIWMMIVVGIVVLPWQIYTYANFPKEFLWEHHHNRLHFTEALDGNGKPWWFFLDGIRISVNEGIYLVLIWFGIALIKWKDLRPELAFLLVWIGLPLLVFSIAKTKLPGYLLFTFPAYFILLGLFLEQHPEGFNLFRGARFRVFLTLVLLTFSVRYGIERMKPFRSDEHEQLVKAEITSLSLPSGAFVFNIPCPIETMFYKDCTAYEYIPSKEQLDILFRKGYFVAILQSGALPDWLMQDERVHKLRDLPTVRASLWK